MLDLIQRDVKSGIGVAPFVGSGVSAASGILMGQQFDAFLTYALFCSLQKGYSIHRKGWPTQPKTSDIQKISDFIENWENDPDEITGGIVTDSLSLKIREQGLELLRRFTIEGDVRWYEVLGFLSRLRVNSSEVRQRTGKDNQRIRLRFGESDPAIIDSYNSHITRGRKPNLAHTMVARLARSLRSRIVLTTNFDTLIEESFSLLKRNLQVFAVSSRGSLPPFETVYAQDSLIKLHGDILETRADETLNHSPGMEDLKAFYEYLRGPFDSGGSRPEELGFTPSNLIILGYSGSDVRCLKMIQFVLDFAPEFHIYWICNSERTLRSVSNSFPSPKHRTRIHCAITPRTDLFLYALYQKVNNSLPGGGFNYEFTHSTPPKTALKGSAPRSGDEERQIIRQFNRQSKSGKGGAILTIDKKSDVMGPSRFMFHQYESERKICIWLDLDDYSCVRNLAFQILSILSLKQGFFQAEHVNLLPVGTQPFDDGFKEYLSDIFRLLRVEPIDTWIFLYGRNAPGACAGFTGEFWGAKEYEDLRHMMEVWSITGVNFVYMPLSEKRFHRNQEKETTVRGVLSGFPDPKNLVDTKPDFESQSESEFELPCDVQDKNLPSLTLGDDFPDITDAKQDFNAVICDNVIQNWLGINLVNDKDLFGASLKNLEWVDLSSKPPLFWKIRFLYALTLFRQSRHPAALVCEATIPCPKRFNIDGVDNDEKRSQWAQKWVNELSDAGVLLEKPGGYQWKYRDVRVGLRRILENIPDIGQCDGKDSHNHLNYLGEIRARTHFWIGDWYYKAFLSSGHFMPLIESIYHRIQTVKWVRFAKPKLLDSRNDQDGEQIRRYRNHLANVAVAEALKISRLGRRSLKFWLPGLEVRGFDTERMSRDSQNWWKAEDEPQYWGLFIDELKRLQHSMMAEGGKREEGRIPPTFSFPRELATEQFDEFGVLIPSCSSAKKVSITIDEESLDGPDVIGQFEDAFKELDTLKHSRTFLQLIGEYLDNPSLSMPSKLSRWKVDWVQSEKGGRSAIVDQDRLVAMTWLMSELAYVLTKNARYLDDQILYGMQSLNVRDNRRLWAATSMVCSTTLDLLRNIHPALLDFELETKAKCLTIYGLSLGQLCRESEAHRRFNEAHAILSQTRIGLAGVSFAALNLRRAEVYTVSARELGKAIEDPRDGFVLRRCISALNDAWSSLELADGALAGVSHSSTWWYRLHCNRLEIIALQASLIRRHHSLGLAFRSQHDMREQLRMIKSRLRCLCEWSKLRTRSFEWRYERASTAVSKMDVAWNLKEADEWSLWETELQYFGHHRKC